MISFILSVLGLFALAASFLTIGVCIGMAAAVEGLSDGDEAKRAEFCAKLKKNTH